MATQIPASLKSADITRYAQRAAQLEQAKPVVAYWCEYWIVNTILSKDLHNADQESLQYTTQLMDKLEQFKAQNAANDAVVDDMAGKAYVEQFGLETLQRAENAMHANKSTRQTADTLQASATFLELLKIWGPLEPDVEARVKFAKYHALRIAKALKAGEDPNVGNPQQEQQPEEALPPLDPDDAEVRELQGDASKAQQPSVAEVPDDAHRLQRSLAQTSATDQSLHPSRDASTARYPPPPAVSDAPDPSDQNQANLARQSSLDQSLHPSRAPSYIRPTTGDVSPLAPQDAASFYTNTNGQDVSPMASPAERKPSIGGNYFPQIPSPPSSPPANQPVLDLPSAPSALDNITPTNLSSDASAPTDTLMDLSSAPSEPQLPPPPTTISPPPAHTSPTIPSRHHGSFLPPPAPGQSQPQIPSNFQPTSTPRQPLPQNPPQLRGTGLSGTNPPQPLTPPAHGLHHASTLPIAANHFAPPFAPEVAPRAAAPISAAPIVAVPNKELTEEDIMKAQKHARWAISALNFEDVQTAIREFQSALDTLGAR